MTIVYILLGVAAALVLWVILTYNRFVKLRNLVEEGWSGIEVQLKRRANLIPNIVSAVKGYMGHERDVLERVTELRTKVLDEHDPAARAPLEQALSGALGRLLAVAEAYPDLKASANFQDLQAELSEVEEQIQLSRRYYNGTVRNLNILVDSFPSNLVAQWFGFLKASFFEIEDAADRAVPKVSF